VEDEIMPWKKGQIRYAHVTEGFLMQRYIEEKKSVKEIAQETGIGNDTVRKCMTLHNIAIRTGQERNVRRHNYVDSAGFNDLLTDWHAYWTGFIAADDERTC
jgi:hypothetical protein